MARLLALPAILACACTQVPPAPIIKHAEFEDTYDDPQHPIPSLTHIEVVAIRKGGGADLLLMIASPLQNDERSLNRLLDKIELYLRHIHHPSFIEEAGPPDPVRTKIDVQIHPDSCPEAFLLLERSRKWVADNDATLEVNRLPRVIGNGNR